MAIDLDDEILQDFLVEAGEIIDLLGEQLVELEQSPENLDLLNAIFRGFHTVKGGAGFLSINALVDVCHSAEDVFNVLRQGERTVTPKLMDVILQVVDVVIEMFDQVRSGVEPGDADSALLDALKKFASGQGDEEEPQAPVETVAAEPEPVITEPAAGADVVEQEFEAMLGGTQQADEAGQAGGDAISEQEFEDLLDALHGKTDDSVPNEETAPVGSDEITEDEFEDLLDQLHGKGQFSGNNAQADGAGVDTFEESVPPPLDKEPAVDEISEEEFEQVLDELHGKGQFSGSKLTDQPPTEATPTAASDDITEEEFEQVLDELHGKGKFSGKSLQDGEVAAKPEVNVEQPKQPEPVVKAEPPTQPAAKPPPEKIEPVKSEPPVKRAAAPKEAKVKNLGKPAQAQTDTTVRVDTYVLDEIMNMVGELVLVRNRFQTLKANDEAGEAFAKAVANLDVVTADLQLSVMKTRMQPIKKVFGRFPRVVRDLARSLKKEIRLELVGEDTDLDKNLVEALADPLVHLVRNAVDHGVESPEDRVMVGKPREGVVVLTASQEGDHILLSIKDDGKGMDPDALRQKVIEKGLMDEESAARLDDKECFNSIFMPGFSTKTEISDVSGRGVGMDVVKTRISQMNGIVEIDSEEGKGSTIIIKVPLTLAIMPTLMVKLGGQAFALPLASVLEILDLDLRKTNVVDGQMVVMVRERALPVFYLSEWLVNDPNYIVQKDTTGHVVVVNAGGRQVGFVVDQLIGQEEVVIKPLGAKLQGLEGLAGATITGDGMIALILDVPGLMKRYAA